MWDSELRYIDETLDHEVLIGRVEDVFCGADSRRVASAVGRKRVSAKPVRLRQVEAATVV